MCKEINVGEATCDGCIIGFYSPSICSPRKWCCECFLLWNQLSVRRFDIFLLWDTLKWVEILRTISCRIWEHLRIRIFRRMPSLLQVPIGIVFVFFHVLTIHLGSSFMSMELPLPDLFYCHTNFGSFLLLVNILPFYYCNKFFSTSLWLDHLCDGL